MEKIHVRAWASPGTYKNNLDASEHLQMRRDERMKIQQVKIDLNMK